MEGSTIHTAPSTSEESLKIAGSAASLFHDSMQSPFDSLFSPANDSNPTADLNITESTQQYDVAGLNYGEQYSSTQAIGSTEITADPKTNVTQYYDYTEHGYDGSGQDYSQYYYPQQYHYDPKEEQEVNIVHQNNNDIFEYQPQDLEGPQKTELSQVDQPIFEYQPQDLEGPKKTELSQVDQPTSQIADNSQISSELDASKESEETADLTNQATNKDTGKLDDLDDLVLGHTTSGTSEAHVSSSTHEESTVEPEANQAMNDPSLNFQYYSTEQDYSYDYGYEKWSTNDSVNQYQTYDTSQVATGIEDVNNQHTQYPSVNTQEYSSDTYTQYDGTNTSNFNYPYTGHSTSQSTIDGISGIHQSTHQYPNYDSNQSTVVNTPPPQSYSPFSAKQQYETDSTNIVNDPLGRSKGCPIVAFGFGGKVFTMFPRTVQRFTSTDQSTPITKYAPGALIIRTLKDIIPLSDIEDFPGPLLMDNNRGGAKAKRKHVIKYLNDQIKVAEDMLNSFVGEEVEKRNPKVEEAVRCILVPSVTKTEHYESNFTVPADSSFDSTQSLPESSTPPSLTYSISPKAIDTLQELLIKGDRIAAINHAMNNNLWTHALIIASCVNKDQWKEVVNGFIKHELGSQPNDTSQSNGRESLRVLYSLFAGHGQNSAQPATATTFPPISLATNIAQLNPSSSVQYNPVPINTLYSSATCDAPIESLKKWRETLAIILSNRSPGDNQAMSALGDMLKEFGWITLDSLWDSLEVKFNKFVAGDAVDENGQKPSSISQETVGPFSHFSAITQQTSDVPSRSVSAAEFRSIPDSSHEARRSTTPSARLQKQINGYQRRSSTPGVGVQTAEYTNSGYNYNGYSPSASDGQISMSPVPEDKSSYITSPINNSTGHFGTSDVQGTGSKEQHIGLQSSSENGHSYGSVPYGQQSTQGEYNYSSWPDNSGIDTSKQQMYSYYQPVGNSDTSYTNDSGWWNNPSPYTNDNYSNQEQITNNNDGGGEFISPMDNSNPLFTPTSAPQSNTAVRNNEWDNIEDDLGLGNNAFNAKKKEKQTDDNSQESTENVTQQPETPKDERKEEKTGWFGRWFGKKEGGGKAANLGEESSFYFDPVQNRWVNKKGGTDTPTTSTPPPPQPTRAKTTSPTPSAPMMNSNSNMPSIPPPSTSRQSLPPLNTPGGNVSTPPVKQR
ncbi:870_t:CDS:2, partial [Racocetra fulgida]